jgi:hypothetical protein
MNDQEKAEQEDRLKQQRRHNQIVIDRHSDYDCKNQLVMIGSALDVDLVIQYLSDGSKKLSFDKVKPVPDELKTFNPLNIKPSILEKYQALDSYTFKEEHWTTPREPINVKVATHVLDQKAMGALPAKIVAALKPEKVAVFEFDTCIKPPSGIYHKMSIDFPKIMFHYSFDIEAPSENTCGWAIGMAGEIKNRGQYDHSFREISLHLGKFQELWLGLSDGGDANERE